MFQWFLRKPDRSFAPLKWRELWKYYRMKREYNKPKKKVVKITDTELKELHSCIQQLKSQTARPAVTLTPTNPIGKDDWDCTMLGCIRVLPTDMNWPEHNGRPMLPLLQLCVNELPISFAELEGIKIILVWCPQGINKDEAYTEWRNIRVETISTNTTTKRVNEPNNTKPLHPHRVQFTSVEDCMDHCESRIFDLLDECIRARVDELMFNRSFPKLNADSGFDSGNHYAIKVGGWPHNHQHYADLDGHADFIMQIISDHSLGMMFADMGSVYIGKHKKTDKFISECLF